MYSFILRDDTFESGIISLSRQLPAHFTDNILHLPEQRGTGLIRGITLEEGLYLRYIDVAYKEDTEIIRLPAQSDSERIFSLCYLLTPGSLKLVKPYSHSVLPCQNAGDIFLTSNNRRISVQIPEGVISRTIEVLFSRDWLIAHMAGMEEKIRVMEDSLIAGDPSSILTERTSAADETCTKRAGTRATSAQVQFAYYEGEGIAFIVEYHWPLAQTDRAKATDPEDLACTDHPAG